MTIRAIIVPYGPSESCVALKNVLRDAIQEARLDSNVNLLRATNSIYRSRSSDVVINYGNRHYSADLYGQATVINNVAALNRATNKLTAFNTLRAAGVQTVEFTNDRSEAARWVAGGDTVYARGTLTGHSGEGITVHNSENSELPSVQLYTKGITTQRREWRVHVWCGKISYVQLKRRRNGYREDPAYREDVRNHSTGWIYATADVTPSAAVLRNAYDAVIALGLDFGAVDLISRGDDAWVLEVNTAPGLSGTTLETYKTNILALVQSKISRTEPVYVEAYAVPAPRAGSQQAENAPRAAQAPQPVEQAVAGAPQVEVEARNVNIRRNVTQQQAESNNYTRGYYSATLRLESQTGLQVENVIVFYTNGNFYRHGWNAPISPDCIRNVLRINSIQVGRNNTQVNV